VGLAVDSGSAAAAARSVGAATGSGVFSCDGGSSRQPRLLEYFSEAELEIGRPAPDSAAEEGMFTGDDISRGIAEFTRLSHCRQFRHAGT
jgi:hypothetical protein